LMKSISFPYNVPGLHVTHESDCMECIFGISGSDVCHAHLRHLQLRPIL
jgi:hypothetical protein